MNASLKSAPGAIGTSSLGTSLLKPRRLLTGVTCPARSSILPSQRPHTNGFPCQTTFTRPVVAARVFNNNNNNNRNNDDFGDRILAALPFLLPLLDGLPYAKFLMIQYPFIARAFAPVAPLMFIYHAFPFAPFLIFLAIYTGIVNNTSLSRFVRYHAMQAVLLDVLLIIPQVILNDLWKAPSDELGLQAYILAYNTLFLFTAVCAAYGMGASLVGLTARVPLVAEAAESQVRDF